MDVLQALQPERNENCPSDLTLTLFDTDCLEADAREDVQAHLDACPRCRAAIDGPKADFAAWDGRGAVLEAMVAAEPHRPRAPWGWAGGLVAVAAAAVFYVASPDPRPPELLTKGDGLSLEVFRERGGAVSRAMSGDAFEAKDRLRFEASLPEAGHVLVFGVEASGATYRAFPNDSDASAPLPAGPGNLLPGAIELDASSGQETLHLVLCPRPFTLSDVTVGTTLGLPDGCRSATFELDKRGR